MYYQNTDIRATTLAISESIKYRKNCLLQPKLPKQNQQNVTILNQQNIAPLFQKSSKSYNNSVDHKKQSRRKAGSIVKIDRSRYSTEKTSNQLSRVQLRDRSNFFNTSLQRDLNNQENMGVYKKLYEQNKVLNEALKSKIYENSDRINTINPLIGLSSFNYSRIQENQLSGLKSNKNQDILKSNDKNQVLNSKYQKMLQEYDKKKNFIKQEIQAMKQKTSLHNFAYFDRQLEQPKTKANTHYGQIQQNNSSQKSKYQSFSKDYLQKSENKERKPHFQANYPKAVQKDRIIEKTIPYKTESSGFKVHQISQNDKEDQIDKKFKAYQQKIQKHKDFEKRNSSTCKKQETSAHNAQQLSSCKQKKSKSIMNKLQNFQPIKNITDELRTFIDLIKKQIQKDQQVRVLKHSIKNVPIQQIQKVLKQKFTVEISLDKLKLNTQEYDPFYESNQKQINVEQLIRQILNALEFAQNFWKNLIVGKFNKEEFQKIYDGLNYGKKDQIGLNQLARQLSFHLNKTIRNRQIFSIYQRISPLTKQKFTTVLLASK